VLYLPQETAVFFIHTSKDGTLCDILYFLVVLHRGIFLSTQTGVIFGDQAFSKCSYNNYFISSCRNNFYNYFGYSLAIYNVTQMINCAWGLSRKMICD